MQETTGGYSLPVAAATVAHTPPPVPPFGTSAPDSRSVGPRDFGPDAINLVAVPVRDVQVLDPQGRWLETIAPGDVQPANLYEAMLKKRLGQVPRSRMGDR